jgi:hypothetical protein
VTQKLVVATFDNLDATWRAVRDLHNFEKDGNSFKREPPEYEVQDVVLGYGGKVFMQPLSW